MGKGEGIKKAFLGNAAVQKLVPDSVYANRLAASIRQARADLKAAEDELKKLPDGNKTRTAQFAVHAQLASNVTAQETAGQTDAAQAWKLVEAMVEQAAALRAYAQRRVADIQPTIAEVNRRVADLRKETEQMRKERRETQNNSAAARLEPQIAKLEGQINDLLSAAQVDPDAAITALDDLEGSAQLLRGGTRIAVTMTPQGQRKASRQTTGAVLGALTLATQSNSRAKDKAADNRLGNLLAGADTEPDQYGLTLNDQIKSALEVFDDQFAQAPDASPDAERENTAMRVAAMASAMALRLVKQKDINDPQLKPVVARAIVQEYGAELARSLAAKQADGLDTNALAVEEAKARQALKLAEALLGEDPVLKLFTGKIAGPDAVESIRRQAEAAGVAPSKMLQLQRQQLEMKIGAMSMPAIKAGKVAPDRALKTNAKGEMVDKDGNVVTDPAKQGKADQGFVLHDLYGELSDDDLARLAAYRHEKKTVGDPGSATRPVMRPAADGGGLEFKPTDKQVHQVKNGDTVGSIAKQLCGPGADDAAVTAKVDEIKLLNKFVFWTEQVRDPQAHVDAKGALKGKAAVSERRTQASIDTFLPNKALPVGAVLTLKGTAGVLDQLEDYVAAWDTPAVPDAPVGAGKLERDRLMESLNLRGEMAQLKEREATGKVTPKVTPQALAQGAARLLPPLRPEVTDELKTLVAKLAHLDELEAEKKKDKVGLSKEQRQLRTDLTQRRDVLKQRLESFRTLAATLTAKLKKEPRSEVEKSSEWKSFEALRLELADPSVSQAPGLGQDHGLGGTLQDDSAATRQTAIDAATQKQARIKTLTDALKDKKLGFEKEAEAYAELSRLVGEQEKSRDAERKQGREGAMNERQYAHLKLLDRWDQDEKERFQAETGETVEAFVVRRLSELLKIDRGAAKQSLDKAFRNVASVPLTITFRAESLFSDAAKDEPSHGTAYVSDAVFTRKDVDLKGLIGRGSEAGGKVAVTGGQKTQKGKDGEEAEAAWSAGRGKNYMRWRTDKDDREAHQDRLPFKDQQIFGAANPNWEKTRGGTKEEKPDGSVKPGDEVPVSANYYGNAHFLLKDAVRKRVAYITRGKNSDGGGKTAFQRKDFLMLFYDMIKGHDVNQRYLKALLTIGKDDYVATGIAWEFHLYGGFDIRNDAQEIHLADVVDPAARARIERFAAKQGIKVAGSKPTGVDVAHEGNAVAVDL
jgi:hypothetical protein